MHKTNDTYELYTMVEKFISTRKSHGEGTQLTSPCVVPGES